MEISLKKSLNKDQQNGTLVTFVSKAKGDKKATHQQLDKDLAVLVQEAIAEKIFSGDKKETLLFRNINLGGAKNVLFVGLGDAIDAESLRSAGGTIFSAIKGNKLKDVVVDLEAAAKLAGKAPEAAQALAEGLALSDYTFDDYKNMKKKKDEKPEKMEVTFRTGAKTSNAAVNKAVETATILAEASNFSKWLGDLPGNLMTPTDLANETVKAAKGTGLKVTIWDGARIKKEGFGGLLGVSLGSSQDPRFIIMEYKGAGAKKAPIVFVGKGLTFDSGGISIKPSAAMEEMKYDMCGGANVIGTLLAIARLKLKINVVGLVPSTENMPGPSANKPGDIMIARNGKTVEIFNTDAEGRLILADALSYASEMKPAAIIDAATLTGAIVMALSNIHTGVFTRSNKLMKQIQDASDATGELVWQMPLVDFHYDDVKGTYADLCNISNYKGAGSSTAAAFLEQFVDEGIPWAHFDIAGTAWNTANRQSYVPKKGATAVMLRTFVELAKELG